MSLATALPYNSLVTWKSLQVSTEHLGVLGSEGGLASHLPLEKDS